MKILVVDDEIDIKLLFEKKFEKEIASHDLDFTFAFSAEEALEFLKQERAKVVLILSDIKMPGMNGLELLRLIKEHYPEMKVVIITAYGDEQNFEIATKFKADDFICKPIDFNYLINVIKKYEAS